MPATEVTLAPEAVQLIWKLIDHLPEDLQSSSRDSFGLGNLIAGCCGAHAHDPTWLTRTVDDESVILERSI